MSRGCGIRPEQLPPSYLLLGSHGPSWSEAAWPHKSSNSWTEVTVFLAFDDFHGVNIPTLTDISYWYDVTELRAGESHAIGRHEPI